MNSLIESFPAQLTEALAIGKSANIRPHTYTINNVYVAGMGGSGIGGDFVKEFITEECPIPYVIGKGYQAPKFIDKHTLFIASSYSGNTEETITTLESIAHSNAKIVCISSGGKLLELAKEHNWDYIALPGGSPSPRAFLGYSIVAQLSILNKLELIGYNLLGNLKSSADLINFDQDEIKNKAQKIAQIIDDKMPVIYTTDRMESTAVRWRQQLNENAKILCWHNVIPEMNHNELVGWKDNHPNIAILYLRNRDDYKRNAVRIDINKDILSNKSNTLVEIYSKGQSLIEKSIYFVHLGDWVSWYLSQNREVDATEIEVIDYLKRELGKL